jgi:hypothetical protein
MGVKLSSSRIPRTNVAQLGYKDVLKYFENLAEERTFGPELPCSEEDITIESED